MASDQMANMELGHLVVGQVVGFNAPLVHRSQQLSRFVPVGDLNADEDVSDDRIGIAIVELGDAALAKQSAELPKASRSFGNRHREYGLAFLAQLCAFRHKAQPIEVHIGAAGNRDVGTLTGPMAFAPGL